MNPPVLTFFNNKGGVGKTSLIYHLAWMFASLGKQVLVLDLDPQANMTAAFLDEDRIEELWNNKTTGSTIFQCVKPLTGVGDIAPPVLQNIAHNLYLLPGDVNIYPVMKTHFPTNGPAAWAITTCIGPCAYSAHSGKSCKWPP